MMTLRNRLIATTSVPSALAIATFYLAAVTHGSDAIALYRMALTFAVAAVMGGSITWLWHLYHAQQDRIARLICLCRDLAHDHDALQHDIDQDTEARIAARAWRQAPDRRGRMRLLNPEDN